MKYDFQTVVSRKNTGAMKWEESVTSTGFRPEVVPLSVADMEFKACPEIVQGIKDAADTGVFGYTYNPPGFMDALVNWMKNRHDWEIKPEWVEQTWGVILALYNCIRSYSEEGDKVIIQTPVYYPFFDAIRDTGRELVESPLKLVDGHYEMDYEDFAEKAKDAKMVLFCSPHNPVGRVWTREELERFAEICIENDLIVVADEIHFDIIMPEYKHVAMGTVSEKLNERLVVCTSPSKTFNLAGLNLANIIIQNPEMMEKYKYTCLHSATDYNNFFGYAACTAGYAKGEAWLDQMIATVESNYKVFKEFMNKNFPKVKVFDLEGTYLCWFDCKCFGLTGKELERKLVDEAWLFLDHGYVFGETGEGFERINLACPESVLTDALERFKKVFKELV